MSKYRNPEFLKLQNMWYKKLKDSGFDDIEEYNEKLGSDAISFLKRSSKSLSYKYNEETFSYYQTYRDFLSHGDFSSCLDRTIWEMYSEGMSIRRILVELEHHPKYRLKRSTFWLLTQIRRLKIALYLWAEKCGLFDEEDDNAEPIEFNIHCFKCEKVIESIDDTKLECNVCHTKYYKNLED